MAGKVDERALGALLPGRKTSQGVAALYTRMVQRFSCVPRCRAANGSAKEVFAPSDIYVSSCSAVSLPLGSVSVRKRARSECGAWQIQRRCARI